MGAEERRARARVGATGAPQHIRWDDPGPTSIMDRGAVETPTTFRAAVPGY